jgi:Inner membrane component of T3SS, cytoplasmic domain
MREILRLAFLSSIVNNPVIIAVAALVVAVIILVSALLLFRNSGKKKRANAAGAAGQMDWQRQGQQNMQGGWNQPPGMPANTPWGQQPNAWAAQQQPGGWDAQQQGAAWGAQNPAQQQPGAWGAQGPAQQQPAAWGSQGAVGGQQPWDAAPSPSPVDPWAQQQAAAPWQQQGPQSNPPAPTAYGSSGSGQSWGPPAQAADQWGQPAQQPAQQGGWPSAYPQPSPSTPPGSNVPWQQQGQSFGQGQQGIGARLYESPEADRTMLRSSAGVPGGIGMVRIEEGKEPGRVYQMHKETLSIGRSRESDIFLEDLAVSRLHASIISLGNNNYALRDEGSANGTKVNGLQVAKYQPQPLQEGDKIQLGQTVLVFARQ